MASKFFHGSSLLLNNNTVPGVKMPPELAKNSQIILQACKDYGLDFYPTCIELLTYDEISEIAAYGGFPVRYPHWSFGMEFEELQLGYEYGMHKIYEMVINTNPCYQWLLASNSLLDNLTVVAHATGHNDFFKNNVHFSATDTNMLNVMANHGTRIRKYMARWGKEKVTEFLDHVLRINTLIDGSKAWYEKTFKDKIVSDKRSYYTPRRLKVDDERRYMDPFINTQDFKDQENHRIEEKEIIDQLGLFSDPTKDILGFLRDNAPLKPWQQDIIAMIYEEALYFYPQRLTKVLNEGWASFIDHVIMAEQGYVSLGQPHHDHGIVEYAEHKWRVLGGKYSTNPYKLGFYLLLNIRDRWDKGQFGPAWEECSDPIKKENWDTKAGLGKDKLFEIRKHYDDVTFIHEFFTEDFCREQEYFEWKKYKSGDIKLESRDYKNIKNKLIQRHLNGGLPDIKLVEPNYKNRGILLLEHNYDNRELYSDYIYDVLETISHIWGNGTILTTMHEGYEYIYNCSPHGDVERTRRE